MWSNSTMFTSAISSFLLCLLLLFLHSPCATADPISQNCGPTGNYTANSTYDSNLNRILSSLTSNGSRTGFFTTTFGQTPDRVYGLVLCRGDINATDCSSCLRTAARDILQLCPSNRDATVWYDPCLLRFSNQNFLSDTNYPLIDVRNSNQSIPDPDQFDKLLNELMDKLSDWAAYNSTRKFATGEVNFTRAFPMIYGLVQCTPDLSGAQCRECLQEFKDQTAALIQGKHGGRTIAVRCNLRYDVHPFFYGAPTLRLGSPLAMPAPGPSQLNPREGKKKNVIKTVLAIAVPLVIAFVLISIICICLRRRRPTVKLPDETSLEEIRSVESLLFDLSTLKAATANFDEANKLGEGGFGAVYKGLLPNGQEIAVKRLSTTSGQGIGELKNELVLVAKLQHKNLVRLLGVCLEEQEKMLVYEFLPNRSLDTILFDPIKREQLPWVKRYNVIGGIARGLLYLHEESQLKIIHRDLKASNILLDADMNPKISDFGLARLFGGDQTQGITNRVIGTFGYMAPEYAMRGKFSIKSDVFSFGVLVLEIVTGRKSNGSLASECAADLLSCTWKHWTEGTVTKILDPSLGNHCQGSELLRCIQIGLLCVQENPFDRPNMSTVVLMLSSNTVSLQAPSRPAFCIGKSGMDSNVYSNEVDFPGGSSNQTSTKSIPMSPNELSISELKPR